MCEEDNAWAPRCDLRVLRARARMLTEIRGFFARRDVLEVETPVLSGGAGTDPHLNVFATELNSPGGGLSRQLFLHTSPEFAMKRLLASGSGSIYQVCKGFRNEEQGRFHNPEFSMLEWYRVGFDLPQLIDELELLLKKLLADSGITLLASVRTRYRDIFAATVALDPLTATLKDFANLAKSHDLRDAMSLCGDSFSRWLDFLFTHLVQPNLAVDCFTFIYDYPACQASLAKIRCETPPVAERVEAFFGEIELANGFFELTDANEQAGRFQAEQRIREGAGLPSLPGDNHLIAALAEGIPDCAGVAVGLDRILMLHCEQEHITDVLAFPIDRA